MQRKNQYERHDPWAKAAPLKSLPQKQLLKFLKPFFEALSYPEPHFALMAISSPPVPSLFPLSKIFSQERRRTTTIQLKVSLDSRVPSNPQLKIKRQNYLRKRLSISNSSGDLSANQPIEADMEVPIDERLNKQFVVSHEVDSFGFSKGRVEREGAKVS